jgi:2-polyprenyl-6-methoxyphenol hydroxylase-like FAD-dependent oxidoreductase
MQIQGSRVAIVGGSIAGCAAAIALRRAGCQVTVYERSRGKLQSRGFGIGTPIPMRDELRLHGYLPPDYTSVVRTCRWWVVADSTPSGRLLWKQPAAAASNNWGVLWQSLRRALGAVDYREGVSVDAFVAAGEGFRLSCSDGSTETCNVLVGADGYRSIVRKQLHPRSSPKYAGYVAWRGTYPEARVADRALIERMDAEQAWTTVVFEKGHGGVHLVPGSDNNLEPGHRRINWLIYSPPPASADFSDPTSVPPGEVNAVLHAHLNQLLDDYFPAQVAQVIRASTAEEILVQPIYDEVIPSYAGQRMLLAGDAGSITRPHTASGATKALADALALERLATGHDTWDEVIPVYSTDRATAAQAIVELGRRIGEGQVTACPDWSAMSARDVEAWAKHMMGDQPLYIYRHLDAESRAAM